ncbi:helix-turn-helix domain-containing protein [Cupidesulfovibrio termitidis]|uniref:helix-turn-helix domain-containing protein n=1 Tax=Nitratidesulfovibrio termitidis TaxID=42252 RepID=UPI0009FF1B14
MLLTVQQAVERSGRSAAAVYSAISQGRLKAHPSNAKKVLIDPADLEAWAATTRTTRSRKKISA